jgi:Xaa-Pro aminopeptidase
MPPPAVLIIDDSARNANLYYATRFLAGDPFIYAEIRGRRILLMSDLEVDRARAEAGVHTVLRVSDIERRIRERYGNKKVTTLDVVDRFLRDRGVRSLVVPDSFGIAHADGLRKRGYRLRFRREPFFPARLVKTPAEIAAIVRAQRATEEVVGAAIETLRRARVRGGVLVDREGAITSERLKRFIALALLERGCQSTHAIVACGRHGVDPHDEGSGPLRAGLPIILDIFPRSLKSRYWADMTRTVVKGRASEGLRRMYRAVADAQAAALRAIRAGVTGRAVHQAVLNVYTDYGYDTGKIGGRMQGFFHGTGHGVGLDIHEPPRLNKFGGPLKAGMVVTVEPGLYYLKWGGVRLEDLVVVTPTGCRNLTRFPKELEL